MIASMLRKHALRLVAGIVTVGLVSVVTACAQGESMSPQESRDKLVTLINDTAALISSEGWDETGAPIGSCSSGSGEGVNASWGLAREPMADHLGDAQKVAEFWKSKGLDVQLQTEPTIVVFAGGAGINAISFSTEPGLYAIDGSSLCVPGTPDDISNQDPGE